MLIFDQKILEVANPRSYTKEPKKLILKTYTEIHKICDLRQKVFRKTLESRLAWKRGSARGHVTNAVSFKVLSDPRFLNFL